MLLTLPAVALLLYDCPSKALGPLLGATPPALCGFPDADTGRFVVTGEGERLFFSEGSALWGLFTGLVDELLPTVLAAVGPDCFTVSPEPIAAGTLLGVRTGLLADGASFPWTIPVDAL